MLGIATGTAVTKDQIQMPANRWKDAVSSISTACDKCLVGVAENKGGE